MFILLYPSLVVVPVRMYTSPHAVRTLVSPAKNVEEEACVYFGRWPPDVFILSAHLLADFFNIVQAISLFISVAFITRKSLNVVKCALQIDRYP